MADPLMKMTPRMRDPFAESDRPMLAPGATDADTRGAMGAAGTPNPNLSPQDQALLEALIRAISQGAPESAAGSGAFGGIQGAPPVR